MENKDYMIRAIAADDKIRAFAVTSKNLVQYAKDIHSLSPLATAALGRLMSASLMMGDMLKSEDDLLTLQINGDGPLKHLLVTSDFLGHVKGYVSNPSADIPLRSDGHLDVSKGIGNGSLLVIRDYHLKQPYSSSIPLQSGEIADDLTYYFAQSEQTPSSVGLGVLVGEDNTVSCAGGFIVQLMPFTDDATINKLQENLNHFNSVTDVLSQNKTPEDLLKIILDGFSLTITNKKDVEFYCGCEKRKDSILATLGKEEIAKMINENKNVEATCAFCNKKHIYTIDDLKKISSSLD